MLTPFARPGANARLSLTSGVFVMTKNAWKLTLVIPHCSGDEFHTPLLHSRSCYIWSGVSPGETDIPARRLKRAIPPTNLLPCCLNTTQPPSILAFSPTLWTPSPLRTRPPFPLSLSAFFLSHLPLRLPPAVNPTRIDWSALDPLFAPRLLAYTNPSSTTTTPTTTTTATTQHQQDGRRLAHRDILSAVFAH